MADYQGKKFKEFIRNSPLSVVKVAKLLEVGRQTVYQYFESENLTREVVSNITTKLGVTEDDIFGTGSKKSNAKSVGGLNYPIEQDETDYIDLGDGKYIMLVPLVNEYAYAGYLSGFKDKEFLEELPKHTIVVDKHHKGKYQAFEIVGDSMDNDKKESIPDGAIVTGREIQNHLWNAKFHMNKFKDYVIVHKTEGITAKRIIDHQVDTGKITCHSLNPDKAHYPDFDLMLDDVQQIFNIVNVSQAR